LSGRILLAEDGHDNQRLISTYLVDAGAEVVIAEDGRIAVDLATRQRFDLILMDMQMPELDGYAATAELRGLGNPIPIVALTAHAMAEDRAKCIASGCTDYLSKPVDEALLLRTIIHHLPQMQLRETSPAPRTVPIAPQKPLVEPEKAHGCIRSSFANVSKMRGILGEYVAGLPEQVVKLTESLALEELDTLRRAAHQLRGSGGGFGFTQITESAAQVEDMLKGKEAINAVAECVKQLVGIIRSVEGYDPTCEMRSSDVPVSSAVN
jgi:CheY-like chemotaxis protein/HPt (histidine-containing phosphotransfer) domain-containing protein